MADITIIIPTIYDYLAEIVTGVPFWAALCAMSIISIGAFRIYRKKRGWY
jgi:hypothetical protein